MTNQDKMQFKPLRLPSLSETPLVSVLMANYNYARYLSDALDSLLGQTYPHFEVIVCDDGSSDNSRTIIRQYVKRDHRIHLVCKENGGTASALNAAYAAAQGEVISFLDADDVFYRRKLETVVSAMRNDSAAGMCIHQVLPVSQNRKPLDAPVPKALEKGGWFGPAALRKGGYGGELPPGIGLCLRKEVTDYIFPLPLQFRRGADGYLRGVAQFLTSIVPIPEALAEYRFHEDNITGATNPSSFVTSKLLEDFSEIFKAQKNLLYIHYGKEIADCLRLEDNYIYWEHLLHLYILDGKPRGEMFNGYAAATLLQRLSQASTKNSWRFELRRRLWQLIVALPPNIAKRVLVFWLGMAPWKKIIRPISRLWRVG